MAIYIAATYNKKYCYAEYVPEDKTSGICSDLQEKLSCQKNLERYGFLFPGQFCVFYENDQLTFVASANCMVSISENQEGKYFAGYIDENANTEMPYPFKKDVLSSLDAEYPKGLAYSQNVDRGVDFIAVAKVVDHLLTHKVTLIYGQNIEDAVKIMRASLLALPIKIANRGYFCTALNTDRFSDYIKDINTEENKNEIQSATTPFFVGCITGDIADHFRLAEYIINIDAIGSEVDCETSYAKYILKHRRIPYSMVQRTPYNSIERIVDFNSKVISLELASRCEDALERIYEIEPETLQQLFKDYNNADRQGKLATKEIYVKIANRLIFTKKLVNMSLEIKNFLFDDSIPFENLLISSSANEIANTLSCAEDKQNEDQTYIKSLFDLATDINTKLYDQVRKAIISFLIGDVFDEHISPVLMGFIDSLNGEKLITYSKLIPIGANSPVQSMLVDAIAENLGSESKQKGWAILIKRDIDCTDTEKTNRNNIFCAALAQYLTQSNFFGLSEWNPSKATAIFELADAIQYKPSNFNSKRAQIDGQLSLRGARKYFESLIDETQTFPNPKQNLNESKKERRDSFPYGAIIPVILLIALLFILVRRVPSLN